VGDVNAYFIAGPEPILLDTGVRSSRSSAAIEAQLSAAGRRLSEVRHVVVTHGHYDHAGAARLIALECGAALYMHERSVLDPRRETGTMEAQIEFLVRCGFPRSVIEEAARLFEGETRFADFDSLPRELKALSGGETIDFGGIRLSAIATPGHSPDHLCFEDEDGVLYSGDMLLPHITPNPLLYLDPDNGMRRHRSLLEYLDSIRRLEGRDFALCRPGHGDAIPDVGAHLRKMRRFIAERAEKYAGIIASGPRTPHDLARAVFGDLDITNLYLANSETIAYLDLLEREGRAEVGWDEPEVLAHPASGLSGRKPLP
jgi:glyoxylase-like metal-dependent hydrolase (beta-lactamase superfamily II)